MAFDENGRGWETFEHTADLGLRVRGRDLMDLLEQAADGLCGTMFEDGIEETESRSVTAEGAEPEELLVAWLEEIIYALEVDGFVTARAVVEKLGEESVEGRLIGMPNARGPDTVAHSVKAVTYHALVIREVEDMVEARVVLDV